MNGADGELGISMVRMKAGDSEAIAKLNLEDSRAGFVALAFILAILFGMFGYALEDETQAIVCSLIATSIGLYAVLTFRRYRFEERMRSKLSVITGEERSQ